MRSSSSRVPGRPRRPTPRAAVREASARGGPTITAAALATAAGFLVLLLSPVPMVRGFAVVLVAGIAIALLVTLTAGAAALVLAGSDLGGGRGLGPRRREIVADARSAASRRRPAATERARPPARPQARKRRRRPAASGVSWAARLTRHPGRMLAVAAALALVGWSRIRRPRSQSDITKLVPANMPALRDLDDARARHGRLRRDRRDRARRRCRDAGDCRVDDVLREPPARSLRVLAGAGCDRATCVPALSLPDLFDSADARSPAVTQRSIAELLTAVPRYFSQAVITQDHRDAVLAFGIRLMPLSASSR